VDPIGDGQDGSPDERSRVGGRGIIIEKGIGNAAGLSMSPSAIHRISSSRPPRPLGQQTSHISLMLGLITSLIMATLCIKKLGLARLTKVVAN
jgi:hypothetical protein